MHGQASISLSTFPSLFYQIIPFCEESPVVNSFSELDVFNDTSVHTFKLSTMSEASRTMWENNSKPLCENDPEIITC